jgi:hypothetical protein
MHIKGLRGPRVSGGVETKTAVSMFAWSVSSTEKRGLALAFIGLSLRGAAPPHFSARVINYYVCLANMFGQKKGLALTLLGGAELLCEKQSPQSHKASDDYYTRLTSSKEKKGLALALRRFEKARGSKAHNQIVCVWTIMTFGLHKSIVESTGFPICSMRTCKTGRLSGDYKGGVVLAVERGKRRSARPTPATIIVLLWRAMSRPGRVSISTGEVNKTARPATSFFSLYSCV